MKRILLTTAFLAGLTLPARAQMISADRMTNFDIVFGLTLAQKTKSFTVNEIKSNLGANVLHPGESINLGLRIQNTGKEPLQGAAQLEIIAYGTAVPPGDIWTPGVFKTPGQAVLTVPLTLDIAPGKAQVVTVAPPIPDRFGAYALVLDIPGKGRAFAATVARALAPDEGPVAFPAYSLDMPRNITASSMAMFRQIGAKASRMELSAFDTTAPDAAKKFEDLTAQFDLMRQNNVTVMLTVNDGMLAQPTGRPRQHLSPDGVQLNTKADIAALPATDPIFSEWVHQIALRYGYPKGPVNAMELWNEPWEGISISGWGADMPRYREIYHAMAQGVLKARQEAKVQVLLGGASSSSNTLDKLFGDGSDEFLPYLDFASIHYQTMSAAPALIKQFQNRKPNRVRTWDTESWIANSEDRVAAVIASMRAMGQDQVKGIYGGNVYDTGQVRADGKIYDSTQAWSVAPAIAAVTKFVGNRNFDGLLFQNGLPWVFSFQGAPDGAEAAAKNPDDGTLIVVGDLSGVYDPGLMLYRGVLGLKNRPLVADVDRQIAALPATASVADRKKLDDAHLRARLLTGGQLSFPSNRDRFRLYDFNGNQVPSPGGNVTVPLDTLGYYLRTDGSAGSFAALKRAVAGARITGYEPLDIVPHDFTSPLSQKPVLRISLTNILNRPVQGKLNVSLPGVVFQNASVPVMLAGGESKTVALQVSGGDATASNTYPLHAAFDGGADGIAVHDEDLHANVIAHKSIQVDGKLDDWGGVLPQNVGGQGIAANLTEKAWLPFAKYDDGTAGVGSGYVAYDQNNFYFAAKIADSTPDEGTIRFAKRDDDQFYYPPVAYQLNAANSLQKKDTVASNPSAEKRALQLPGDNLPAGRDRARAFYETTTAKSFAADLHLAPGTTQQVALYFVDNDPLTRRIETIEMLGPDGTVLDKRVIKNFGDGIYAVYAVSGEVRFKLTTQNWTTAVLGGVFLDPTIEIAAGGPARFLRLDTDTSGDWKGKYGASGYHLAALNLEKLPPGASLKFPEVLDKVDLVWPEGVRRYSYRMRPILPFNTGDDVQIAFNAVADGSKPWLMNPPGVPSKWMVYPDTDYEYGLHAVAPSSGGGTEVWRLSVPGMPRKHFYPRQPVWPGNKIWHEGAVENAKLAMTRDGNTRLVELALPWSEIPDVKAKLDAGQPLKFSFRVCDNGGQPYELAQNRSVSKVNFYTFHPDFNTHWSNEIEFGWEK